MLKKPKTWPLFLIIALAMFLRFWGLGAWGMQGDGALNAVRAFGWFDFLVGEGQTSPLVWFGYIPWWAHLSFHDHPPLVFFIQHIFFLTLGSSEFVALLPFALAGTGSVILLYFLVKRNGGEKAAWLAALLLAVSTYASWSSRGGYLEEVEGFFIALSLFFALEFFRTETKRPLFFWAAATGLALLSKYTSVYLLPAFFLYLLWRKRQWFFRKELWLAFLLIAAILSPVIIYNVMVFRTRGHFDAALSSMVGMRPTDYAVLSSRSVNSNLISNLRSVWDVVRQAYSWPLFYLEVAAVGYVLIQFFRKRAGLLSGFILLNLVMLILMFGFAGGETRFLTIILAPLCILSGAAVTEWLTALEGRRLWRGAVIVALALAVTFEGFFSVNSNILRKPVGTAGAAYFPARINDEGFKELGDYMWTNILAPMKPQRKTITTKDDLLFDTLKGGKIVLFDDRPTWFSRMWYVSRYNFYYTTPIVYVSELLYTFKDINQSPFTYLASKGVKEFWFVLGGGSQANITPTSPEYKISIEKIQNMLASNGIQPVKEIKDYRGETVFSIYNFYVN